ncbi:hypothetical protein [Dysgonomonas macrotermitis]|uniref:DUF3298 domain-containing protein n=1 Tax=Dysgonomonas macrotermitis TaxID=1346286 RepID=A0A1M5IEN1_9BACT|nr:hypothetical protein [Dysgonomonas macrotermitis]SHG26824.1 hypothetical protein SAMN05444362_11956 [Dysgonomonas macrotermitis]
MRKENKPKYTIVIYLILFISGLVLPGCGSKNKEKPSENKESEYVTELKEVPIPTNFEKQILRGKPYPIGDKDTVWISDPFIKVYEGIYEEQKAQLILVCRMGVEDNNYRYHTSFYQLGREAISSAPDGMEIRSDRITLGGDVLYRTEIGFRAYDKYSYRLKFCSAFKEMKYNYGYEFSFTPKTASGLYSKVFASEQFRKLTLGENYTETLNFKHSIDEKVLYGSEDDCYNCGYTSLVEPVFMDSTVFIVRQLEDTYMGGAHGMYNTDYYNFSVETGKLIPLDDIVNMKSDDFNDFFYKKVKAQVWEEREYELDSKDFDEPHTFYTLPTGLVFVFPMYALGGGAWEKEVFISYTDLRPYLKMHLYNN